MESNLLSLTEENYLKTLYLLANEQNEVSLSELSRKLDVSSPTANSMIKNLHEKELVIYEKYKPIIISKQGKLKAAHIIRKHRLTEMYLVEQMGFGWEEVHPIAEQIEHIQAPTFFDKMDEILGFPEVDPHGSPIPNKKGAVVKQYYIPLAQCMAGDQVTVKSLNDSQSDFLNFLNSRSIELGTQITIHSIEQFDLSMVVSYGKHQKETLSLQVCERLLVSKS